MPKAIIYVAMHEKDDHVLCIKDPIYKFIHCGKAIYQEDLDTRYPNGYLPEFGDNTGDNISELNHDYCELTAMYWAWKNDKSNPEDIIGLVHYRRYFAESEDRNTELMSQKTMEDILINKGYHFIINCCDFDESNFEINDDESVYIGFKEMHDINDLDNALIVIHKLYPDIADKMEFMIKHNYPMAYCNMIITKKKYFDEYASFLFSVLDYVYDHCNTRGNRGAGYVAERLLRPWLLVTGHSATQGHELDWSKYSGYKWSFTSEKEEDIDE